jgi:hypothetical protein
MIDKYINFLNTIDNHKCNIFDYVVYVQSNGTRVIRKRCVQCGELRNSVKKSEHPDYDKYEIVDAAYIEARYEIIRQKYQKKQEQKRQEFENEQQRKNKEWWEWYNNYLLTYKWRNKRQRVLERDKHICQSCLINKATEVHHLSYKFVGNEPLFQLVSICDTCHKMIHDKLP